MSRLPAALGWTGVALILAPLAVLCLVAAIVVAPWLGLALLLAVGAWAKAKHDQR